MHFAFSSRRFGIISQLSIAPAQPPLDLPIDFLGFATKFEKVGYLSSVEKRDPLANSTGLEVYPNLSSDFLNLTLFGNAIEAGTVVVYNSIGEMFFLSNPVAASSTINVSNWDNGLYIISYTIGEKTYRTKFVKN